MMRFAGFLPCALLLSLVGAVASSPADTGAADAQFLTMDPRMYSYAKGQSIPERAEGGILSAAAKNGEVDADGATKSRFVAPGGLPATQLLSTGEGEKVNAHTEEEENLGEALADAGEADLGDADEFPVHEGDDAADESDNQGSEEENNDDDHDGDDGDDDDKESSATQEMLRDDGDPGDAQDTEETLDDNHDKADASVTVASSDEAARLRSADLKLMNQLGTADLGKGSVGGELVSRLLGSTVISHSSGHFSTVYSRKRSEKWAAKHPVLLGQGASVDDADGKKKGGRSSGAAARAAKKIAASKKRLGAAASSGVVLNGTANGGNGTMGANATAPLLPPPLKHLLPLLRFFDHRHKDHICNTDPYEFSNRAGAFQFQGIVAFVYGRRVARESTGKADKELVPFYRYWDQRKMPKTGDHFFSLEPEIKLGGNVTSRDRSSKIVPQGVAGYLYTKGYPGLVPLNEYRSNSTGEHLYSVSGTGGMTLNGEGFAYTKTLGYVQPIDAFAKRKAELARKAREASETEEQKKKDREEEMAKRNKAPKEPESLREVKKRKWHPGQPLFVDNLDWSK